MKPINLKIKLRPIIVLGILLILILAYEAYLVYSQIYQNLDTTAPYQDTGSNIVRLDLNAYNATINLIDQNANYVAPAPNLANSNPF